MHEHTSSTPRIAPCFFRRHITMLSDCNSVTDERLPSRIHLSGDSGYRPFFCQHFAALDRSLETPLLPLLTSTSHAAATRDVYIELPTMKFSLVHIGSTPVNREVSPR